MSTNYTGDDTATQAPSALPAKSATPVVTLPADGDALNAASVAQAFKVAADAADFTFDRVAVLDSANTFTAAQTVSVSTQTLVSLGATGGVGFVDTALTETAGSSLPYVMQGASSKGAHKTIVASLQTTDATSTTCYTLAVPTDRTLQITTSYVGHKTDHTTSNSYVNVQAFRNAGGTVTEIGAKASLVTQQEDAGWGDGTWTISTTNVLFKLVGKAATTIDWRMRAEVVEIG